MAGGSGGGGGASGAFHTEFANSPVFTGPDIVFAEDLAEGDVVRILRGKLANRHPQKQDIVVMALRDAYLDFLPIATPSADHPNYLEYSHTGALATEDMRHLGLMPARRVDSDAEGWSTNYRAQRLGLRVATVLLTREQALDQLHLLNKLHGFAENAMQEAQGVEEVPLEERVLRGFISQATGLHQDYHYQADLRGEIVFSATL